MTIDEALARMETTLADNRRLLMTDAIVEGVDIDDAEATAAEMKVQHAEALFEARQWILDQTARGKAQPDLSSR